MIELVVVLFLLGVFALLGRGVFVIVPQQHAYVVERLGQYNASIGAGFHILVPFLDRVRFRHSLLEEAMDLPQQVCVTRDNASVGIESVLAFKVRDPRQASYSVADHRSALALLAQTTLCREVGKVERASLAGEVASLNLAVFQELGPTAEPWGLQVLRYEIKNVKQS